MKTLWRRVLGVEGFITGYDGEVLRIAVPFADAAILERKHISTCDVLLHDGRSVTPAQRRKIFALISDITDYTSGFDARRAAYDETLRAMQLSYLIDTTDCEQVRRALTFHYCSLKDIDLFSLSVRRGEVLDMTTASDFIDWLVELCVEFGVPCIDTLLNRCEDIQRYLYACVANRKCCICGGKADIHEVDAAGMGRNRRKISHRGQRVQPLCRVHHNEVGQIGQQTFNKKYHLEAVKLDEHLCKKIRWRL